MRLLAIDTSGPVAGAATHENTKIVCFAQQENKRVHSCAIAPMIDFVLSQSGWRKSDIEAIAVTTGPGSFTGIRIGLSVAKAMSQALGIPSIGIDTLDALCYPIPNNALRCAVMDARRQEVYCAAYWDQTLLVKHGARPLREFLSCIEQLDKPAVFVGDGVRAYREEIAHTIKEVSFLPEPYLVQMASSVACLAARTDAVKYTDAYSLKPDYYRLSQAEREAATRQHDQQHE